MAKATLTVRFQLEAPFETLQTICRNLADETTQAALVSRLRETALPSLSRQNPGEFQLRVVLDVPPPHQTRSGPRLELPKIENGQLSWYDEYAGITNRVGPVGLANYMTWLETEENRSFRYVSDLGSFTAIKENRRGRRVWYAHRRQNGQLRRVYLGRSENLTAGKLAETARKLNPKKVVSLTEA